MHTQTARCSSARRESQKTVLVKALAAPCEVQRRIEHV